MKPFVIALLVGVLCISGMAVRADEPTLRISAAISLKNTLEEIIKQYEAKTGGQIELNLGASGALMAQIREGAPIDLFISAAQKQVDDLVHSDLADKSTRTVIAKNALVLIVPADQKDGPNSFDDLKEASVKRIAIGQPRTVPAGDYATQVLKALKLEHAVKDRLVYGENVRQVLDYVSRGEVDAGIVYKTDAMQAAKEVRVCATAKEEDHKPIEYPAIVIKNAKNADQAREFVKYLTGKEATKSLEDHGFVVPDEKPAAKGADSHQHATTP